MKSYKTNFFLLDSRDYVHSSSIISTITDILLDFCSADIYIENIKFRSEVKRNGFIEIYNKMQSFNNSNESKFQFQFQCNEDRYFAYFFEKSSVDIVHRIYSNYYVMDYELNGFINGNCNLYFDKDIYSNIIQFNKMLHLSTFRKENIKKVTNLLMNNIPIFRKPSKSYDIKVHCENLFHREMEGGVMTLNRIDLMASNLDVSLEISFLVEFDDE